MILISLIKKLIEKIKSIFVKKVQAEISAVDSKIIELKSKAEAVEADVKKDV